MSTDSTLQTVPGTQMQGINGQGISINKDHVEVHIDWVDPVTKRYFDPTTYAVVVTKDAAPYTPQKVMVQLSRVDDTVGVWHYAFLTSGMLAGSYVFTFTGSRPADGIGVVTHVLGFTAAEIPVEQYFIGVLRTKLLDKRASRYLIDDNMRVLWEDGELYSFCDDARLRVGQTPPSPGNITWEQGYAECHDLIVTGGFIYALEARGIFEIMNKFSYTDELSLNIDRSVLFQNAQSLSQTWMTAVMMWKRDHQFHLVRAIGLQSGKFPLYYSRVLSLLPNMSRIFYG